MKVDHAGEPFRFNSAKLISAKKLLDANLELVGTPEGIVHTCSSICVTHPHVHTYAVQVIVDFCTNLSMPILTMLTSLHAVVKFVIPFFITYMSASPITS